MIELKTINGIERRVISTDYGVRYDDLVSRQYGENTVKDTFQRPDGSQYMLSRALNARELAERRAVWADTWKFCGGW